jgi:hypothetical protein
MVHVVSFNSIRYKPIHIVINIGIEKWTEYPICEIGISMIVHPPHSHSYSALAIGHPSDAKSPPTTRKLDMTWPKQITDQSISQSVNHLGTGQTSTSMPMPMPMPGFGWLDERMTYKGRAANQKRDRGVKLVRERGRINGEQESQEECVAILIIIGTCTM